MVRVVEKILCRRFLSAIIAVMPFFVLSSTTHAEGSRSLYPNGISGARAYMDLSNASSLFAGVTARRQFLYVYAKSGEYILLGSSNRNTNANADIFVYDPQSFGTKGNETVPASANFACSSTTPPAGSFSGDGRGYIAQRVNELAGPHSADGTQTAANGFLPCAYRAPADGVYGVLFTMAQSGGGAPGNEVIPAGNFPLGNNTVAAWDITVRASADSLTDIDARVFTYAWVGHASGSTSRIHHTIFYATRDGARYRQIQRGFAPVGYALWANNYGFLDNGQPLYHDLRGTNANVDSWIATPEIQAQRPQEPLFFSDIDPAGTNAAAVAEVLETLGIPLTPLTPLITDPHFNGLQGGNETYVGGGGTFTFVASNNTTFQIVVSADGSNFDPALAANATLTGLAPDGANSVIWNGLANDGSTFPVGTFTFRIVGRNGEIHFPIVDVEGSGSGGPSVIKLNGLQTGDATVYYDDRGYVTRDGAAVGTPNDALCGTSAQPPPSPPYSLLGIDSNTLNNGKYYRHWTRSSNNNTDCNANSGFGDAKALDLWTYQQTLAQNGTLIIGQTPTSTQLATQVSVPASAEPGSVVHGSLHFQNVGAITAQTVTYGTNAGEQSVIVGAPGNCPVGLVFDALPPGVTATGYDAATCVATFSGMPTTLNGATPAGAGERLIFNFHYFAPAFGDIPVSTDTNASNSSNHPTANGVTVVKGSLADLAIIKTDGSATYVPGAPITYTLTLTNSGPGVANSVDIIDTVPASITGVTASCSSTGSATCGTNATSGNSVSFRSASITAAATDSITLTVSGTVAANTTGTLANTATVVPGSGASFNDPNAANDSSTDTDTRAAQADLSVVKTGPAHVDPGQDITYSVVIANNGTDAADGATYSDPVPSPAIGAVAASCGNATGGAICASPTVAGNDVSGTIPTLPAGGSVTITITGTVAANSTGIVVNTATVSPPNGTVDPDTSNNASSTGTSTPVSLLRFEVD